MATVITILCPTCNRSYQVLDSMQKPQCTVCTRETAQVRTGVQLPGTTYLDPITNKKK